MRFCCRYNERLHNIVRDFGARFSDIDAIYRRVLNDERLPTMQPKWWKSLWVRFWRRYTTDAGRVMRFMATLDENQVIDIASGALGATSATHREFQTRHGLGHAYAANERRGASALNSAGVVLSAPAADDLQMSIDPSSVLFPSTHSQPPHAQTQSLDIRVPANALGLPFVGNPKGSNRRLSQSQNAQYSQDNRIELQEVVVHGLQSSADLNHADAHLKRVVAGHNPADEFQVSVPKAATSIETAVVRTSKMIGAFAPESKGSSVEKLSIVAARRHAGSMRVDCSTGQDLPRDRPIDEDVDKLNPHSIDQGTDGAIIRTCVAAPPPRSRSASRMRPTNRFDAMNPAGNNGFGKLPSASSKNGGQVTRQATATTSLSPRELSSSLHQHQSSRPPPRFQNQASSSFTSPPVARSEEKADGQILLNGDAADTSTMADAGASCEVQKQATHAPRSRLHSRVMPDAVSDGAGVSFASIGAPREAAVRQAHIGATAAVSSFQSSAYVARPSLLLDATNQGAKAAPAEQSSKKRLARLSVRQPPKSWDDKVKSLTDKFEEC